MELLSVWRKLSPLPWGKKAVTTALCVKIPFFKTIRPQFEVLEPNYCKASMPFHRSVINHLGSIHAIAMCNMAEFAGGAMCEVTIPKQYRWIPKGMQVEYLKKGMTDLTAIATPKIENWSIDKGDYIVQVELFDKQNDMVFRAEISMKVSVKRNS